MFNSFFNFLIFVPMTDDSMKMPKMDMKDMNVGNAFQQFLGIIRLDKKVIEQVAVNEKGGPAAALFLFVGVALTPLLQAIMGIRVFNTVIRPDMTSTLMTIVGALVAAALGFAVTTLVATKLFKGKGTFPGYFRVVGLAYGLNVLSAVGVLVPGLIALVPLIVGIWGLVVGYTVLKSVFHLDNTNAVLTIIVTVVAMFVIMAVLGALGLTAAINQAPNIDFSDISISY